VPRFDGVRLAMARLMFQVKREQENADGERDEAV
jgi:hypothetical protein